MVNIKDIHNSPLGKIPLHIRVEIGSTDLRIEQLMKIGRGAIIEIGKDVEGSLDLKIGDHLVARGQLEIDGDYFSVRIIKMTKNEDEIHTLFHT